MTTLLGLPQECFDTVVNYLQHRHLARLFMTGSSLLETRLRRVQRRTFRNESLASDGVASTLFRSIIIGCASEVETTWSNVSHLALEASQTFNVRTLRVVGTAVWFEQGETIQRAQTVMDKLWRLETLDLSVCAIKPPVMLTIPSTVMSLTLGRNVDARSLSNLNDLPLTHLTVTVNSEASSHLTFLKKASWCHTITSLSLHGTCCANGLYLRDALPTNLLELQLGTGSFRSDVSFVVSRQTCLQRLSVGAFWSVISPLPTTLVHLKIHRLMFPSSLDVDEIPSLFPPSVTSFWFVATTLAFDKMANFMERMMPSLSLESALKMIRTYYDKRRGERNVPALSTSALEQMVVGKLKAAGLSEHHLSWLSNPSLVNPRDTIADHAASQFFQRMPTKADMALLLPPERRYVRSDCSLGRGQCDGHYEFMIHCIEWGLLSRIVLTTPIVPTLSETMLRHLRSLDVYIDAPTLETLLWRHPFPSLTSITIQFGQEKDTHPARLEILSVLWRVRHHLPCLEKVSLWGWHTGSITIKRELQLRMADMKLYRVAGTHWFSYRVTPPRNWMP